MTKRSDDFVVEPGASIEALKTCLVRLEREAEYRNLDMAAQLIGAAAIALEDEMQRSSTSLTGDPVGHA